MKFQNNELLLFPIKSIISVLQMSFAALIADVYRRGSFSLENSALLKQKAGIAKRLWPRPEEMVFNNGVKLYQHVENSDNQ